jgi:glycosyltransferase involved in cell wall biosynthesis
VRVLVYGVVGSNLGGIESYLLKMNSEIKSEIIFDYVIEGNECVHKREIDSYNGLIFHVAPRYSSPFRNIYNNINLLLKKKKSHSIVYFNLSSLSWILPIIIARLFRYHVIVHAHNSRLNDVNNTLLYRTTNYLSKWLIRYLKIYRFTCSKLCSDFFFSLLIAVPSFITR